MSNSSSHLQSVRLLVVGILSWLVGSVDANLERFEPT